MPSDICCPYWEVLLSCILWVYWTKCWCLNCDTKVLLIRESVFIWHLIRFFLIWWTSLTSEKMHDLKALFLYFKHIFLNETVILPPLSLSLIIIAIIFHDTAVTWIIIFTIYGFFIKIFFSINKLLKIFDKNITFTVGTYAWFLFESVHFLDFGKDWYFMLSLFKFTHKWNSIKSP